MTQQEGTTLSLNFASLPKIKALNPSLRVPFFNKEKDQEPQNVLVHISVGMFHLAHQSVYTELCQEHSSQAWHYVGMAFERCRSRSTLLRDQDYLFTVLSKTEEGENALIVSTMLDYILYREESDKAIQRIANHNTRIITLTVTEKGYMENDQGTLDREHELVKKDIQGGWKDDPQTLYGLMAAGLERRRCLLESSPSPLPHGLTVLSCDNLPHNGAMTKGLFLEFLSIVCPPLKEWVNENVSFPNAMVDRITPCYSQAITDHVQKKYGFVDRCAVLTEDFKQWVIEDSFVNGRPPWDAVGALIVPDVSPYEKMKIRLLNGTHSAVSYLSFLMGLLEVDQAFRDELISKFAVLYMKEIRQTVPQIQGIDLEEYSKLLITRFRGIKDDVMRLAQDGSKKIRNACQGPIEELLAKGTPPSLLPIALGGWIRFMEGTDQNGQPITLDDPLANQLKEKALLARQGKGVKPFLELVFGVKLAEEKAFERKVQESYDVISSKGAREGLTFLLSNL